EWGLDPSDAGWHEQRVWERKRKCVLAKGMPYALAALGIAVAFGVYWNFETLRGMRVTFAPLRDLARGTAATADGGRRAGENAAEQEETVEALTFVTVDIDPEAPPPDPETPADAAADETPAARLEARQLPIVSEAAESAAAPAAADAEPEPPPAPPPPPARPPEPESFVFGLPRHEVSESEAAAAVLILRNGGDGGESSVTWWTTGGSATPGADYVDPGRVTERFPPGAQNRTIRIPLVGDRLVEGPETFYIHLEPSASGANVPADRLTTEIVIVDDD